MENMIGKKFNRLTVLDVYLPKTPLGKKRQSMALCRCDCGRETEKRAGRVKSGETKECAKCASGAAVIDMAGKKIQKLKVLRRAGSNENGKALWLCLCDCGNECEVLGVHLRREMVKSCGCKFKERDEQLGNMSRTHGMSKTKIYKCWNDMKARCNDKNKKEYPHYGGRGITYQDSWSDFDNFYKDMGDMPTDKHTLDRIDVDSNYCKENCKWATRLEQGNNKRNNVLLTHQGRTQTMAQWTREFGVRKDLIADRLRRGHSHESIFKELTA